MSHYIVLCYTMLYYIILYYIILGAVSMTTGAPLAESPRESGIFDGDNSSIARCSIM